MKRILILLLCILPTPLFADDIIGNAMQTVVAIFPADPNAPAGGGSGVVISPDGYAVTNFHVVQPCGPAMKCAMADGKLYDTVVVGLDPVGDIALIKLLGRTDFPHATFADSNSVAVGDTALVMGNPFLLATDFQPCVSKGIISGTHRYQFPAGTFLEYTDCLQTDAAVNPGNSGGPLFNDRGEIIGIVGRCSFEKRGRVNVGIGYAVSSNQVQYFLGDLKSGRIVDHASLNAVVSTDRDGRVLFDDVLGTSDAFRSGLRYNDELLRFAGQVIDSANTFKNLLGIFPKHWRLPITVRGKEGTRHDIQVRLAGLHGENELIEMTEEMIAPPIEQDEKQVETQKKEPYISEAVKPFYEARRGFANYYFNKVETDRVLHNLRTFLVPSRPLEEGNNNVPSPLGGRARVGANLVNASAPTLTLPPGGEGILIDPPPGEGTLFNPLSGGEWHLTGTLKDRSDTFSFQITDKGVQYTLPTDSGFWNADLMLETKEFIVDPTTHYQSPRGSGGLFAALYLYRCLAMNKPMSDAEIVYTGTAPIGGNLEKLYDVCTVTWRGNDVRFYVDSETGAVPMIEMAASGLDFPCEVLFGGNTMEVRYGRIVFGVFEMTNNVPSPLGGRVRVGANLVNASAPTLALPPGGEGMNNSPPSAEENYSLSALSVLHESVQKIVKIYGAESGGTHGYQSGILISPDGYILTALTSALQTDPINVVLDSGRKFDAQLTAAEPVLEIALLKIDGVDLPFFEIDNNNVPFPAERGLNNVPSPLGGRGRVGANLVNASAPTLALPPGGEGTMIATPRGEGILGVPPPREGLTTSPPPLGGGVGWGLLGTPIYALSNPFNISQGNEHATVQRGHIAARTRLSARRGVFETPYKGEIFVLDITTNNPGACGGALILAETGELLGMLGKELRNNENHSWLNFALPVFVWRETVKSMMQGGGTIGLFTEQSVREQEMIPEDTIRIFQRFGILLVPAVSRRTPPFIDSVRPGSEAARLGLLPDDLIVMVNNQLTPSLSAVESGIHQVAEGETVTLTIERNQTLRDVRFVR